MTQRLTQAFVDAQAGDGRDRIVFDSQVPGLGLRVTPTGTRIFVAQGRVGRRKRRITLGLATAMTLAQARTEALHTLAELRSGKDPTQERKARQSGSVTVAALAERWMADFVRPKLKPRTAFDYERLLSKHILPALGHLSIADISHEDVERLHVDMGRTPRRANYTIATVRALLNFGVKHGLRPAASNPARGVKMYREKARERFLSEAEIAAAADAIDKAEQEGKIGPFGAAGLRLALFTGARSGENHGHSMGAH